VNAVEVERVVRDLLGLQPRERAEEPRTGAGGSGSQRDQMRRMFMERMMGGGGQPPDGGQPQPPTNVGPRGPFVSVDLRTNTLFVTAPADKLLLVEQVVKSLDIPENADDAAGEDQTPRIEVYPVDVGTAEGIAKIMDTTFRRSPETRVSPHPDGRALIVAATPREHELIKAVLVQLKGEGLKFEVMSLRVLDAGSTVSLIKAMLNVKKDGRDKSQGFSFFFFPIPNDDDDKPGPNTGFSIEADVERNRLLVRGTESQISQVRDLLVQMGETGISRGVGGIEQSRFRVLPLGDRDPDDTARQLERLWSRLGAMNQIRVEVLSDKKPADDRTAPPDAETPSAPPPVDDPIAAKVEELKGLSAEEQEAEIAKLPAFLRQRVR
ncbi:MAG: secretin N-terminal domain-containing protein, partial [Planctomycetia bacterium]